jgi:ABC-type multidrug transport system ATPase subunit
MLDRLKRQGIGILVSTPYMDEASRCDRIALMRNGRCLTTGTPDDVCQSFQRSIYSVRSDYMYRLLGDLRNWAGTHSCYAFGDAHHLTLKNHAPDITQLEAYLEGKGYTDVSIHPIKPGVEDCFMELENK